MVPRPARPSRRRPPVLVATLVGALLHACGEKAPQSEVPATPADAHIFAHEPSGVGLELPALWAGRFRTTDSITAPVQGLERELRMRLIRGDSSLVAEPLLVVRVFSNAGWDAVPPDSAGAWWGTVVAKDAARTVAVRPAPGNPLAADQPDAATFDSLMISLLGRQMKASLRAPR